MPVGESHLLGFVSCLVMKAWARQSILLLLFGVYTCASDMPRPGSWENCVAFLQLPAEVALLLPGHTREYFTGYELAVTYDVAGNGIC